MSRSAPLSGPFSPPTPFDRAAIGLGPAAALVFLLTASWVLPAGPLSAFLGVLLIAYLLLSPARANGASLRLALPFLAMACWALLLSRGNDRYIVGKDFWYAGKLCLCLMLGFLAGIRPIRREALVRGIVGLAAVMAVVTLVLWWRSGVSINELDAGEDAPRLPLVATVALIPLLDLAWTRTGPARAMALAAVMLLLAAVVVSNSRITIIATAVMILAWAGLFSRTWRALLGGAIVLAAVASLWQFLPEYQPSGELTVAIKMRRSLDEMLLTDNVDLTQMILNWRGFEAYNAQLMFDQSNLLRKLFGNGLGAVVDLGEEIDLGDGNILRYIPILHNGFYYIVIKYGLVGLFVYTLSIVRFGVLGKFSPDNLAMEDRMLRGAIVAALLSTLVITGLFNKTELHGLTVLLGWLVGHAQRRLHDESMAGMALAAGNAPENAGSLPECLPE